MSENKYIVITLQYDKQFGSCRFQRIGDTSPSISLQRCTGRVFPRIRKCIYFCMYSGILTGSNGFYAV